MNWDGFFVGAGTGIIAVLVSAGIMRLIGQPNSKGTRILHIVVFAAAMALGREFVEPRIQAQQVESKLLEMPIYQVLQQYEPDAYMKIRATIEHGIANHQPLEQVWSVARSIMGEVTIKRLPHASDQVLIKFAEHIINTTNILYSKGGDVCFSYINPAPGEAIDFSALLGEDATQQELDLLAEVVTSSAGQTIPPVPEQEAAPDIETVIHKLRAKYNQEELASLQNPHSPDIDKRKYCQIIVDLYGEAKALPEPRNSRLIRHLAQSQ